MNRPNLAAAAALQINYRPKDGRISAQKSIGEHQHRWISSAAKFLALTYNVVYFLRSKPHIGSGLIWCFHPVRNLNYFVRSNWGIQVLICSQTNTKSQCWSRLPLLAFYLFVVFCVSRLVEARSVCCLSRTLFWRRMEHWNNRTETDPMNVAATTTYTQTIQAMCNRISKVNGFQCDVRANEMNAACCSIQWSTFSLFSSFYL